MLKVPDYEVKMLVNPEKTLNDQGEPNEQVKGTFALTKSRQAVMQFMDSVDTRLQDAGWNVRVRAFEKDKRFQLTYKRRYAIDDDIEAAIVQAANDGFAATEETYDLQVEWGFDNRTLTVSWKADGDKLGTDLPRQPSDDDARAMARRKRPPMLDRELSDGADDLLAQAHTFGPVEGVRWSGRWLDDDVDVEIWRVKGFPRGIVEASLKKQHHESARELHDEMHKRLDALGWLAHEQLLKTKIILDRYRP